MCASVSHGGFFSPDSSSQPGEFTQVGSTLLFTAVGDNTGRELWKTDGTESGTTIVKDILPGAGNSFAAFLVNVGGTVFFAANDGANGGELWKTDGTTA